MPWELIALQHWIFYLLCIAGYLKQDEILSHNHQSTAPSCISFPRSVPSWMPLGCSPSCLDDMDIFLQIHQNVTHTAETQHLPRAGKGRALGTLSVTEEGMEGGLRSGETIRQQLLVLSLLCQFGKLRLPCLLWGFLLQIRIFISPPPHFILNLVQVRGHAFVCSSLQLRPGCWITSGIETPSYWKSSNFLSQWHMRPVPTFLAYFVLCRASPLLKNRDGFGVYALLYLPLPSE